MCKKETWMDANLPRFQRLLFLSWADSPRYLTWLLLLLLSLSLSLLLLLLLLNLAVVWCLRGPGSISYGLCIARGYDLKVFLFHTTWHVTTPTYYVGIHARQQKIQSKFLYSCCERNHSKCCFDAPSFFFSIIASCL